MTEHTVNLEEKTAATESPRSSQAPTTANPRSSLSIAIARHIRFEKASFHTPGHKGRQSQLFEDLIDTDFFSAAQDLTELPGLDDLSAPKGVIADLEGRYAAHFGSRYALTSVNGASAALTAAILATANRGQYALVPRNAHRSVVHALCLAKLKPIWYAPDFEENWGFWGGVPPLSIKEAIERAKINQQSLACALVVSPTYGGALSDIAAISDITKVHDIPLIVDEAHGAHFLTETTRDLNSLTRPLSAIACGADAVAHSLHKTLPALTQTGMLHLPAGSLIRPEAAKSALNLVSSSSPSYLLLASIEKTISLLESTEGKGLLISLFEMSRLLRESLSALPTVQLYDTANGVNPSHVLVSVEGESADHLYEFMQDRGIFAEAKMGAGVLLMLGLGSQQSDIELALTSIDDFVKARSLEFDKENGCAVEQKNRSKLTKYQTPSFVTAMSPHEAILAPQESISSDLAQGRVAAQFLAPCPPGIPILIPGQMITEEVLKLISDKTIMVVAEEACRLHGTRRN